MASDNPIEADRLNAQRDTGPESNHGGIAPGKPAPRPSSCFVLPNEDAGLYQARLDAWLDEYRPQRGAAEFLVRQAVELTWKIDRANRYEAAVLSQRIREALADGTKKTPEAKQEAAAMASFDPSVEGERLRRYQVALNRELARTVQLVVTLQRREARFERRNPTITNGANEAISPAPNEANSMEMSDRNDSIEGGQGAHAPRSPEITEGAQATDASRSPETVAPIGPNPEITCEADWIAANEPKFGVTARVRPLATVSRWGIGHGILVSSAVPNEPGPKTDLGEPGLDGSNRLGASSL